METLAQTFHTLRDAIMVGIGIVLAVSITIVFFRALNEATKPND